MDPDYSNVSIVMASLNEQEAVEKVINDITRVTNGKSEIILVDSSDDTTPEIARSLGVKVIRQEPKGIGLALREGFKHVNGEYIFTLDVDGTYHIDAIPEMVSLLQKGIDVVSAVRLQGIRTPNMTLTNTIGNYLFVFLVSILYNRRVHDVTTGFRGFKKEVIDNIQWTSNYGLSSEMLFRAIEENYEIKEIQYPYHPRIGETKLMPFKHGMEIFLTIIIPRLPKFVLIFILSPLFLIWLITFYV